MINFVPGLPTPLEKFLSRFDRIFSKPLKRSFRAYIAGLMLGMSRCNIEAISKKTFLTSYQALQYFASDSKWNPEELNTLRVSCIQETKSTKSLKNGVLAIDDTGCFKYGTKTEGAQVQHYGTEDRLANCNVVVVSAYCDAHKRWPVNLRAYKPASEFLLGKEDPDFKSKIQLAQDLFDDALEKEIEFSDVVFDAWYFADSVVQNIEAKGKTWISEADVNRRISLRGKWVRADELVKLIPSTKFTRKVTLTNSKGKQRTFYLYGFTGKVKGLSGKKRIVIAKGSWSEDDPKKVHIFVTNHLSYNATQVILKYGMRWGIEQLFRDLKENTAFDQYQVRSLLAITRHWHLSFLAYTFLIRYRLTGSYSKVMQRRPKTIGDCLRSYQSIQSLCSYEWISKNHDDYIVFLGFKHRKAA